MTVFYDLASLAKPLVTAPLALAFLDLAADRRWVLGFHDRDTPLTVRQLLSHTSGLPPWRPYTGASVAAQLRSPMRESHALLRPATPGLATYSDLNYRLLAELLEAETGVPFRLLGEATGLSPWPWRTCPVEVPEGPDAKAWPLATAQSLPARLPDQPHDCNARAGMQGHAGFGTTPAQCKRVLERWVAAGWPARMALDPVPGEDGTSWGLGLQVAHTGPGRFGHLLASLPLGLGLHILESSDEAAAPAAPPLNPAPGVPSGWWYHLGYTGPALFYRPADQSALVLLLHRRGPAGELLDAEALRARRWRALVGFVGQFSG